ncbi:hypothetical protein R1flu_022172 [Riccia fluitans]|uniref:Uncharacterized protein n=1 Tax=Riccia fluitans TaxID=41844 RepID=A0ABD1ZRG9_9MARC
MKTHQADPSGVRLSRIACQFWVLIMTVSILSGSMYMLFVLKVNSDLCLFRKLLDQRLGWRGQVSDIAPQLDHDKMENLKGTTTPAANKPKQMMEMLPLSKASVVRQYLENGSTDCHHVATAMARVFGLPTTADTAAEGGITLSTDQDHDFLIVSYAKNGHRRCSGGDYYEVDLSGPRWKHRPPVQDLGNGSYLVRLRVQNQFEDAYQLKIILLFGNLHGLNQKPDPWSLYNTTEDKNPAFLATVNFRNDTHLIEPLPHDQLPLCSENNYGSSSWRGRWTRTKVNGSCTADTRGRFKCFPADEDCATNWCKGPLGRLESTGWVYSRRHCSFRIFSQQDAWSCVKNKWIYFWGDSNHQDSSRNLLNFFLGYDLPLGVLPRSYDRNFSNPENPNESVRISTLFNGHDDERLNFKGLLSLKNESYREKIRSSFGSREKAPDFVVLNSGLHDCHFWSNFTQYVEAAENASQFWYSTWSGVDEDVHKRPMVVYRTTIAPSGPTRASVINPQKVELMNAVMVDSFLSKFGAEVLKIVDEFDMSFPFHYDRLYSDGQHYGRIPNYYYWIPGGHHYFVDLMLVNIHLNILCPLD